METKIIDNHTLIQEEQMGYGSHYNVGHETEIADPEVRARIAEMAIEEIVS